MNLVDLARADPVYRCANCGVVLRLTSGRLVDGGGQDACASGTAHTPRVAASPGLGWLRG